MRSSAAIVSETEPNSPKQQPSQPEAEPEPPQNETPEPESKEASFNRKVGIRLHDEISGENYSYQEIQEIADQIRRGEL